jgi:hypothetical protein
MKVRSWVILLAALAVAGWAPPQWLGGSDKDTFAPKNRLVGIGLGRKDLTEEQIQKRSELMIDSMTFAILRDPRAVPGAARINSPRLQKIFKDAEQRTGVSASLISAVAYLESWGDADVQSPTGPKGIMQIAAGTARSMGLRMIYATRYRTVTEKRTVKGKRGKTTTRSVRVKRPYQVLIRDERMVPERAIPAAAAYLGRLEKKYGGMDWAVFAYHCGEGCVTSMKELTEQSKGIKEPATVAKMFFGGSPAFNRELYSAIWREMDRDYSPTYWFRIMRAQELLAMYREDPSGLKKLAEDYSYEQDPNHRAPHRLSVWLKEKDLAFQSCEDLKREQGKRLAKVLDDEAFYGFRLRKDVIGSEDPANAEYYLQAAPAAIGTLAYITFETRRLHAAMKPKGERFQPLDVTSLVQSMDIAKRTSNQREEGLWHCTGQVFDIDYKSLPVGEREALDFVLADMGWMGYLGFVDENPGSGTMHVGSSPSSRDFFTQVFQETVAVTAKK